jgi:hypothetical protein
MRHNLLELDLPTFKKVGKSGDFYTLINSYIFCGFLYDGINFGFCDVGLGEFYFWVHGNIRLREIVKLKVPYLLSRDLPIFKKLANLTWYFIIYKFPKHKLSRVRISLNPLKINLFQNHPILKNRPQNILSLFMQGFC